MPQAPAGTNRPERFMPIDYEVEYNNRARVPEHPEIFARWQRDAQAYRTLAASEGRAELGIKFGDSPRQLIDLFLPNAGATDAPLAMFIHGGYWRSLEPSMFSQMARGMNAHGIAVAVSGYDLVPQVTIRDIVAQTQAACVHLWKRFGRRIMVSGHSAGGHLAACMLATDWAAHGAPAGLVPAAMTVSGVHDLMPLLHLGANAEFKLDDAEAKRLSPIYWPAPNGRTLDAVVGRDESAEFLRQSRIIADAWAKDNATRYEAVPGMNHFTVCDAMTDPDSAMTSRLVAVTRLTQSPQLQAKIAVSAAPITTRIRA
jgi:arylformamidase